VALLEPERLCCEHISGEVVHMFRCIEALAAERRDVPVYISSEWW
jgi:hypothetical protein